MEESKSSSADPMSNEAGPRVRFAKQDAPRGLLPDATDSFHEEPEIHDSTFKLKAIKDEQEKERMSAETIDGEILVSKGGRGAQVEFSNPMFRRPARREDVSARSTVAVDAMSEEGSAQGVNPSPSSGETSGSRGIRAPQQTHRTAPSRSHADHARTMDVLTQNPLRVLGMSKFPARHDFLVPPVQEAVDDYADELATEYVRRVLEGMPQIDLDLAPRSSFSRHLRSLSEKNALQQQRKNAATGPTSTLRHHMSSQTDGITERDEEERVAAHSLCTVLDLHDRLMSEKTDLEKLPGRIRTTEGTQLALVASERANLQARDEAIDVAKLEFQQDHANCLAELLQLARTIQSRQAKFQEEEAQLELHEKELNRLQKEAKSHLSFIEKNAGVIRKVGGGGGGGGGGTSESSAS